MTRVALILAALGTVSDTPLRQPHPQALYAPCPMAPANILPMKRSIA